MDRNNLTGMLSAICAVVTAVIGANMGLSFGETLLCGILSGLLGGLIILFCKELVKKKVYAQVSVIDNLENGYTVSVLLWNSSFLRSVYVEDYGKNLILNIAGDVLIDNVVMNTDKKSKNFIPCYCEIKGNRAELMGPDINFKGLAEIRFNIMPQIKVIKKEVIKKAKRRIETVTVLPFGMEVFEEFDDVFYIRKRVPVKLSIKTPNDINLIYSHKTINMVRLNYKSEHQMLHWISVGLLLFSALSFWLIIFGLGSYSQNVLHILIALWLLPLPIGIPLFASYDVFPAFVLKYLGISKKTNNKK